jgi:hypothetical protein
MSRLTLGWLVIRVSGDITAVIFRVDDRGSSFLLIQRAVTGCGINPGIQSEFVLRHKLRVLHWYTDVILCGRSLAGIVGSNPAGGMSVSCEFYVLSRSGLFVGLITRTGEPYGMWCV